MDGSTLQTIMIDKIPSFLQHLLIKQSEMPIGFRPLTVPIDIDSEEHILRSISSTLEGVEFYVTA